ncbi:MAG: Mo-dependent nitrogenase C-terminal domain-containing protein [Nostoc sp. NMS1]|uniref:Mo-dependent nitrogenase C-terminal domain-containing protein n=1 Tax=unclassified Nostoc TaxID=2593658 RepID=UPI0025CB9036|nr:MULTISPECIES: Mo-dependent nitrogenase C-terminal domain-containing protein [unclassified Nostoc]MBN3907032.1 Mo-dependent nitrogenase C-terminal domain-containing protein [Nostoc sp. NMS1]MBN3992076.1 Mo-dependent nitrogenase C-terminal domain-containing protein [Nostoc sp. NMS2]
MNNLIASYKIDLLYPIKKWLESLQIRQPKMARLLCKIIPASCPFEREIKLLNRTIAYIPPLCKLNPFYDQIVEIRFKSLSYLANECGEDVTLYC